MIHRPLSLCRLVAGVAVAVLLAALPAVAAAQVFATPIPPVQPACTIMLDPIPSGSTGEPGDTFTTQADYHWVHSGTQLQGKKAREKWGWGFWLPSAPQAQLFNRFRTVVIVNNPDPVNPATVDIEYRDTAGNLLQVNTRNINPEGFWNEPASPLALGNGLGTIRVVAHDDSPPFVGATVHHSFRFDGVQDYEPLTPPDAHVPGLASMQQLQEPRNGASVIYGGPFPTTSTGAATHTFLRGNLPTFQVINPNNAVNTLGVTFYGSQSGTIVGPIAVTLQPYGSYIDLTLLNALYNPATNAYFTPIHDDWIVLVNSSSDLKVIGEELMLDFYDASLTPFSRFRMTSGMMATRPALYLYNSEMTYQTFGPPVHTISAISNVSSQDIGPVVIEYRDPRSGFFATDVLPSFPSGASQRIAPGEPNIVNYPVPVWDGNIRIRACKGGLIGWSAREVEPDGSQQFRKAYGESLDGANLTEPGTSFAVTTLGLNLRRKVAPLDRCALFGDFPPYWPAYTAVSNFSVPNVGTYYYQFFQPDGIPATDFTLQPFAGIRWAENSFTFEDGPNRVCLPPFIRETSGRVDHTNGSVKGIDVIGDPLYEWNLGIPQPPVYTGPGDVVPTEPLQPGGGVLNP
jgi:hypothetical protein